MMQHIRTIMLLIAGGVHLLPAGGVLGEASLLKLYGLPIKDPNLLILMQHRAVLFGLLGLFLVIAAFKRQLQALGIAAGLISAGSFIAITLWGGNYNAELYRVFIVDVVVVVCLLVAALTFLARQPRHIFK